MNLVSSPFSITLPPMESDISFTESDANSEDDYVAVLARQMTQFMFQDDDFENECSDVRLTEKTMPEERANARRPNSTNFWSFEGLIEDQIRDVKKLTESRNERRKKKQTFRRKLYSNLTVPDNDLTLLDRCSDNKKSTMKGRSPIGTGVFIPKASAYGSRPTKKPNAPTIIIPARVLQTLTLHFDKIGVPNSAVSLVEKDGVSGDMIYMPFTMSCKQELDLPHEWIY